MIANQGQDDRYREPADHPREKWPRCVPGRRKGVGRGLVGGCAHAGVHQAEGLSVSFVRGLFIPDLAVNDDAAADGVAVALRHDIGEGRRRRGAQRKRPRQGGAGDLLRLGVEVQIVDVRHGSCRAEDFVGHHLGVERRDAAGDAVARRGGVSSEKGADPADGEHRDSNHDHDDQRQPHAARVDVSLVSLTRRSLRQCRVALPHASLVTDTAPQPTRERSGRSSLQHATYAPWPR